MTFDLADIYHIFIDPFTSDFMIKQLDQFLDAGGLPIVIEAIYGYSQSINGITTVTIGTVQELYHNGRTPMVKMKVLERRSGCNVTARNTISKKAVSMKTCNLFRIRDYVNEKTLQLNADA